jgi:CRP/FNR family cyclic AMP-dependent transcriptional regulator
MIGRFQGLQGAVLLAEEMRRQRICIGVTAAAAAIAVAGRLVQIKRGATLIQQASFESDVHFIISGGFEVLVNGRKVGDRGPGEHVGEMSAIVPIQARSADVIAKEDSLVLTLAAGDFLAVANKHPSIWQGVTRELINRLDQRSRLIKKPNLKPRVFLISSSEALPVARTLERQLSNDPIDVVCWPDNVFQIADYNTEALERELERADFAIAVVSADDVTISRHKKTPSPRDNVIFELGFFMGRLGRRRAILMVPAKITVKLPSDFFGLTGLPYDFVSPDGGPHFLKTCKELREHIRQFGSF